LSLDISAVKFLEPEKGLREIKTVLSLKDSSKIVSKESHERFFSSIREFRVSTLFL